MLQYSDILITADFDRTLTGPDSRVPERNLEAIRWFMDQGGTFTVNTGRSLPMTQCFRHFVPVNAPLLLYNGSAAYDLQKEEFLFAHEIELDQAEILEQVHRMFPQENLEVQGQERHYTFWENPAWVEFTQAQQCAWGYSTFDGNMGPFLKCCLFGKLYDSSVKRLFEATQEEKKFFFQAQAMIEERWGDKVEVFLSADRILDVHAKGVSKLRSARELQEALGKKVLVCIGDAHNDIQMLRGADFSYCPGDAIVADMFENVCPCGQGAVADVIYKKIPEILAGKA